MNILENRIVSSSKGRRIEIMLPDRLSLILCEGAESSALLYYMRFTDERVRVMNGVSLVKKIAAIFYAVELSKYGIFGSFSIEAIYEGTGTMLVRRYAGETAHMLSSLITAGLLVLSCPSFLRRWESSF
jgi:hypothetical protein